MLDKEGLLGSWSGCQKMRLPNKKIVTRVNYSKCIWAKIGLTGKISSLLNTYLACARAVRCIPKLFLVWLFGSLCQGYYFKIGLVGKNPF